jgi:molybdenum cofactor cytidylyltransferase
MSDPSCAAVILAAGASRRLGQAKQLVKIGGEPLLGRTVRLADEAGCQPIVVVLGFEAEQMRSALDGCSVIVAVNEDWRAGMGSSIRCGVETALHVNLRPENILLLVCDQFRLSADVLRRLLRLRGLANHPITAARYSGQLGVPAVFSSIFFPDLLDVSGDQGARGILRRNAARVGAVDFPEGELDLDTPDHLEGCTVLKPVDHNSRYVLRVQDCRAGTDRKEQKHMSRQPVHTC